MDSLKESIQRTPLASKIKTHLSTLNGREYFSYYDVDFDFGCKTLTGQFTCDKAWYRVIGHFFNDTLFSVEISKRVNNDAKRIYKPVFQYLDTLLALRYVETHNNYYSSNSSILEFFTEIYERFGYACGLVGEVPVSMLEFLPILKNKDKQKLIDLAGSLNPTDRAYGALGLYILMRTGTKLSDPEKKIILLNQKSKACANNCSGCIVGTGPLNKLLDNKSLKWFFNWYKANGDFYTGK